MIDDVLTVCDASALLRVGIHIVYEMAGRVPLAQREKTWSRKERPRVDTHPTQVKIRWERTA